MKGFKERLENEKVELDIKIDRLNKFIRKNKSTFEVNDIQLTLLNIQVKTMETYSQCLLERMVRL